MFMKWHIWADHECKFISVVGFIAKAFVPAKPVSVKRMGQ